MLGGVFIWLVRPEIDRVDNRSGIKVLSSQLLKSDWRRLEADGSLDLQEGQQGFKRVGFLEREK